MLGENVYSDAPLQSTWRRVSAAPARVEQARHVASESVARPIHRTTGTKRRPYRGRRPTSTRGERRDSNPRPPGPQLYEGSPYDWVVRHGRIKMPPMVSPCP